MVKIARYSGYGRDDIRLSQNSVRLVEADGRESEKFTVNDIFGADATNSTVFHQSMAPYVSALKDGMNVSLFHHGSSRSGKEAVMAGEEGDAGLVSLLLDQVFQVLEDERFKSQQYTFNVKVRFMELRDEEAHDLLHPQGGHGFNKNALKYNEWEGAYIQGINWVPVFNKDQASEFFKGGL